LIKIALLGFLLLLNNLQLLLLQDKLIKRVYSSKRLRVKLFSVTKYQYVFPARHLIHLSQRSTWSTSPSRAVTRFYPSSPPFHLWWIRWTSWDWRASATGGLAGAPPCLSTSPSEAGQGGPGGTAFTHFVQLVHRRWRAGTPCRTPVGGKRSWRGVASKAGTQCVTALLTPDPPLQLRLPPTGVRQGGKGTRALHPKGVQQGGKSGQGVQQQVLDTQVQGG
jgi:hypothetical protein